MSNKRDVLMPNGLQITREDESSKILLRTQESIMSMMETYFHEVGHHLALNHSFKSGDVLTLREAANTKIDIKPIQKLALFIASVRGALNNNAKLELKGLVKEIADSILMAYTKGKWDPNSIDFKNASVEELENIMRPFTKAPTYTVDNQGKFNQIFTRKGRNLEVPAFGVAEICMTILANSFNQTHSEHEPLNLSKTKPSEQSSHERAKRIAKYLVRRATFRGDAETNPNIPSDVDQAESIFQGAGIIYPSKEAHQEFLQKVAKKVEEFGIPKMTHIIMNLRKKLIYDEKLNDIEASVLTNSYLVLHYEDRLSTLNSKIESETLKIFDQIYGQFIDELIEKHNLNTNLKDNLMALVQSNVLLCLKFGMNLHVNQDEVKKILEKTVSDYAEAHQN